MEKKLFMATVERGLEEFANKDLAEEFGVEPIKSERKGKIFFFGTLRHIPLLNFAARSINRLILILSMFEATKLSEILRGASEIDWSEIISHGKTFAVRVERVGHHDFTSMDVARELGALIIKSVERVRSPPKVNLKNPDVIVYVDVFRNSVIIGIDTTGASLHMRRYRKFCHPRVLKTTVAYAMVRMANWNPQKSLLDPMCGGGTIPIEAALFARRKPHFVFRDDFAFLRADIVPPAVTDSVKKELKAECEKCIELELKITAGDINETYLRGAIENAESAGVLHDIKFFRLNARRLSELGMKFDAIVFDPPYHDRGLTELYRDVMKEVKKALSEEGKAVVITPRRFLMIKILKELGANFKVIEVLRERNLRTGIFIITFSTQKSRVVV